MGITTTVIEMDTLEVPKIPPIEISESPDFKIVYASGIFGTLNPSESTMIFYIDRPTPMIEEGSKMKSSHLQRELQMELRMSHDTYVTVYNWMGRHIDRVKKGREKADAK